jgi:ABC-type multidrug transport system ATPase subunit
LTRRHAALRISELNVELRGKSILTHVNLAVDMGESVALIGHNGSGKTTLLRAVLGWLPVADGMVTIGDHPSQENLSRVEPGFVGAVVGDAAFVSWMTPTSFGKMLLESSGVGDDGRLTAVFDDLQVDPMVRKRRIGKLSQGERGLISIAYAMLRDPSLLLLDEPFAHLDGSNASHLESYLVERVKRGCALVYSCHSVSDLGAAQRVVGLSGGTVVGCWDPDDPALVQMLRGRS